MVMSFDPETAGVLAAEVTSAARGALDPQLLALGAPGVRGGTRSGSDYLRVMSDEV
jgi:hypothetical protein